MRKAVQFLTLILLVSCEPKLSDEGKKELNNIRNENYCYQVQTGNGSQSSSKRKGTIEYITVIMTNCEKKLDFDSIQFHSEETKRIAKKIFFECMNKENYDGIEIQYNKDKKGFHRKSYFFIINKDTNLLNLTDSLIIE